MKPTIAVATSALLLVVASAIAAQPKIPASTKGEILERCTKKWQSDENRYEMIDYCIGVEIEAWQKIQEFARDSENGE